MPTPSGVLDVAYSAAWGASGSNATVTFAVGSGQAVRVCLALPGAAADLAAAPAAASDVLTVDGAAVATEAWGRFLCTASDVAVAGTHVARRAAVAA